MDEDMTSEAEAVATALGHRIADHGLLRRACTHASRVNPQADNRERAAQANERLEFLGDALLAAALAEWACERFPDADEGHLSRVKSRLASRAALAAAWDRRGLGPTARLGATVGPADRLPESVKANLAEAVLAAVYLDGGWPALVAAVRRLLAEAMEEPDAAGTDPCMRLQTWALAQHRALPVYESARSGGSDHAPEFTATVTIGGQSAQGTSTSVRRAKAAAAAALLAALAP
ncbi:MAG: ribonuclease [Planctomycetota bacterium]